MAVTASGRMPKHLFPDRDGDLVVTTRHVSSLPDVVSMVNDLLASPTPAERDAGLTSVLLDVDLVTSAPRPQRAGGRRVGRHRRSSHPYR